MGWAGREGRLGVWQQVGGWDGLGGKAASRRLSAGSLPLPAACPVRRDPYAGEVAHCLDAISRWYACDIERFGYLMQ